MAKIICRKVGRSLVPVDDEGFDALAKVKDGRDVKVEFTMSRNLRHHRLFFAALRFVKMHSPRMCDVPERKLRGILLIATGYCDTIVDAETGKVGYMPVSMSFESMDQTEFSRLFDSACEVICNRWMPAGTTPKSVRNELIRMVDGQHAIIEEVA